MKFTAKISAVIMVAYLATMSVFAQSPAQQSRLNVGSDAKVTAGSKSSLNFFSAVPNKLNFNSKAEYTRFYRNLLLNGNTGTTGSETKEEKTVAKSAETIKKIKFGNIFPNPANNFANVEYEVSDNFKDARVAVLNMVGASVLEYPLNSNGNNLRLNTSGLESGIYMVQFIVDGKKVETKKLLVERK